jgi:DNA-binding transcriptional LysR family regulator
MSIADGVLSELKIADVVTFLTVNRTGSISSAARELMVTPSQVSKTIGRLEQLLGTNLLSRSANGITLLDEGHRVVPQFEQMLDLARTLRAPTAVSQRVLGFAAPSYIATFFAPLIAAEEPSFRLRLFELPPRQIRAHLSSGHFDIALTLGEQPPLAASWEHQRVGELHKALFCSPATARALPPGPVPIAQLAELPIVSPIYFTDAGFLPVDDDCPVSRRDRTVGHETTTLGLGLALAIRTNQLVFGPVMAALPFLEAGTLVKVEVEGHCVDDAVYLAFNTERITRSEHRMILGVVERGIASIPG